MWHQIKAQWDHLRRETRWEVIKLVGGALMGGITIWGWISTLPGPALLGFSLGVIAFSVFLMNGIEALLSHKTKEQSGNTTAKIPHQLLKVFLSPFVVLIALSLFYLYTDNFLKEDQKTKRELEGELAANEEYIRLLSGKITDPYLTPRREERLREALKQIGPHTVSITYRDDPSSRPSGYAGLLGQVFQSVLWKVEIHPKDQKEWPRRENQGLLIRVYDRGNPKSITAIQRKVISAFRESDIQIEFASLDLPIGQNTEGRIELMIGDN